MDQVNLDQIPDMIQQLPEFSSAQLWKAQEFHWQASITCSQIM